MLIPSRIIGRNKMYIIPPSPFPSNDKKININKIIITIKRIPTRTSFKNSRK